MTILVAANSSKEVALAWDAQSTTGSRYDLSISTKVCKAAQSMWIGSSGSLGTWGLISTMVIPEITRDFKTSRDVNIFAQQCSAYLAENFHPQYSTDGEDTNTMIVVSPYGVWAVASDYSVLTFSSGKVCAIGAGAPYAYGAFHALHSAVPDMPLVDKAVLAAQAACKYSLYCGGPIKKVSVEKWRHK